MYDKSPIRTERSIRKTRSKHVISTPSFLPVLFRNRLLVAGYARYKAEERLSQRLGREVPRS